MIQIDGDIPIREGYFREVRNSMSDVDVRCLHDGGEFRVYADRVLLSDGAEVLVGRVGNVSVRDHSRKCEWRVGESAEGYIRYDCDLPVLKAAYDLAIHELERGRERGDIFETGANWKSLWTRDVAYAIHLGLAFVDLDGCRESLARRVFRGEVIQDTGTGGGWPVSTDRVVWGIAAWEVYVMTGDDRWLREASEVLERTCRHDDSIVRDSSGLMRGESSFLDWRAQSYPDWMTPADIAESCSLSTMVLHAQGRDVLSRMKRQEGKRGEAAFWRGQAQALWQMVEEKFWVPDGGYYGQFLYGRGHSVLSERPDSLGNLLCVLFGRDGEGASSKWAGIVESLPHCSVGIPCFHPQKSMDVGFYHNGASWPFVEAYYGMAASTVGNGVALEKSLACLVRSALLLGTNKENINLETGRDDGLVLSSDSQLWSIAGMLGVFYKGIFGMEASVGALAFRPCVPRGWGGSHRLIGGAYCKSRFDLLVRGEGCKVARCLVNGVEAAPELRREAEGYFSIEIELEPWGESRGSLSSVPVVYDVNAPRWKESSIGLEWESVPHAGYYKLFRNGELIAQIRETIWRDQLLWHDQVLENGVACYQVMACSSDGRESFLSEPKMWCGDKGLSFVIETLPAGAEGEPVRLKKEEGAEIGYPVPFGDINIPVSGVYRVEALYSNGMESVRDGNTCALCSLLIDGERYCTMAFPHGGEQGDWDKECSSPGYHFSLDRGVHHVALTMSENDENSNYFVNECIVRRLRFVRIGDA